jgi:hypothetical protein
MVNPEAVVREAGCVVGPDATSPHEQAAAISKVTMSDIESSCFMPPMITQTRLLRPRQGLETRFTIRWDFSVLWWKALIFSRDSRTLQSVDETAAAAEFPIRLSQSSPHKPARAHFEG